MNRGKECRRDKEHGNCVTVDVLSLTHLASMFLQQVVMHSGHRKNDHRLSPPLSSYPFAYLLPLISVFIFVLAFFLSLLFTYFPEVGLCEPHAICASVYPTINFGMPEPIFMKLGMFNVALKLMCIHEVYLDYY
jgi:hypothetical protein